MHCEDMKREVVASPLLVIGGSQAKGFSPRGNGIAPYLIQRPFSVDGQTSSTSTLLEDQPQSRAAAHRLQPVPLAVVSTLVRPAARVWQSSAYIPPFTPSHHTRADASESELRPTSISFAELQLTMS
jgi:hypothetical protein